MYEVNESQNLMLTHNYITTTSGTMHNYIMTSTTSIIMLKIPI